MDDSIEPDPIGDAIVAGVVTGAVSLWRLWRYGWRITGHRWMAHTSGPHKYKHIQITIFKKGIRKSHITKRFPR